MDTKLQQLNSLIDFFKKGRKLTDNKTNIDERLPALIEWLKEKRTQFLKENLPNLKKEINKNFKKLQISSLSLMEYDFHENSHSNIIRYLIDFDTFEEAPEILAGIVKNTSYEKKDELCEMIKKKTYSVNREFPIRNNNYLGRIDLFIKDTSEKFVIIIENKVLAEIGLETNRESEDETKITQLEKYKAWCERKYPGYSRLYILLSFNNLEGTSYEQISYEQLYDNLKQVKYRDNILNEYLLLLRTILKPEYENLIKIKKLAKKIIEEVNPEISLYEYSTLKNIFYYEKNNRII